MTSDPLTLLREDDPASGAVPDAEARVRMDAELERLLRSPAPRRPRRLAAVAAAVAAAGAAVVVALPAGAPEPASAATVLRQLGDRVSHAPGGSGRFAYERREQYITHMGPDYAVVLPHEEEQWIAADGTGVVRTAIRQDRPVFPTEADRRAYEAAARPPGDRRMTLPADGMRVAGFTPRQVRELPADAAALRSRLETAGVTAEHRVTAAAGALLGSSLTPPEVKRALFEVLRTLPGATVVEDARDPRGRAGVGISFASRSWKTLFIFDPADGSLLATRSIGTDELPDREIEDWSLVIETGRRDSAPRPTDPARVRPAASAGRASR